MPASNWVALSFPEAHRAEREDSVKAELRYTPDVYTIGEDVGGEEAMKCNIRLGQQIKYCLLHCRS